MTAQITVRRDTLKALLVVASTDFTRMALNAVAVESGPDGATLTATDGHRLLTVELAGDFLPSTFSLTRDAVQAAVKAAKKRDAITLSLEEAVIVVDGTGDMNGARQCGVFPNWRHVEVARSDKPATTGPIGLNPAYLADVGKVGQLLADDKGAGVRMQLTEELSPLRFDFTKLKQVEGFPQITSARMMLMPIRC